MTTKRKDYFESLFDRKTLTQRRMILLLNATNERWISSEWLGEKLGLSKRTILSTINELSEQMRQFQPNKFAMHLSKSRGVFLDVKNDADIYELITFVVSRCPTVILLESLLTEEFESVKSYAIRNFISESTVRRDLIKVQRLLAHYQIEVGREKAQLIGAEHQIRMVMAIFYWSVYRGSLWPFPHVDEYLIEKFVDKLLNNEFTVYPRIPYGHKKQVAYLFAEAIIRTRKGHFVHLPPKLEAQLTGDYLYPQFEARLRSLQGLINIKASEIPYFLSVWLSLSKTMDILKDEVIEEFLAHQAQQNSPIYTATELMISRFQDEFFPIKKEEMTRFRAYIYSGNFFAFFYKNFNTDLTGNTYRNFFYEKYPRLIKKTKDFIEDLYRESKNPLFLEVDYLLIAYLRNICFLDKPCNYEVPITVLVESDLPRLLIQKFIRQVKGYFGDLYNLTICDIFDNDRESVDLLLTTSNLKGLCQAYPEAEIAVVTKSLSMVDMARINRALEQIAAQKSIIED